MHQHGLWIAWSFGLKEIGEVPWLDLKSISKTGIA